MLILKCNKGGGGGVKPGMAASPDTSMGKKKKKKKRVGALYLLLPVLPLLSPPSLLLLSLCHHCSYCCQPTSFAANPTRLGLFLLAAGASFCALGAKQRWERVRWVHTIVRLRMEGGYAA